MASTPRTASPRRLDLRLLGAPQVEVDRVPVEADTRKALALLAYLAVSDAPRTREALGSLLWPDHDQTHAGAALRRTLSAARSAIGGRWLIPRGRVLQLETADLRCDLSEFRALIGSVTAHHLSGKTVCDRCRRRLERAIALYRGDFLEGFSLRDSPEFDDWQALTATSVRTELADALLRLTDACAALGQYDVALRHARRWLALDPLHEPAHRRLMELRAANGDRAGALRQYRECVRVLDDELGVPPLPETTETYQRIAAGELLGAPVRVIPSILSDDVGRIAARPRFPLVGRSAELGQLVASYDASGASGRVAFVEGEAGIGKSRLAEELAAVVASRRARVLTIHGRRSEAVLAYASIAAALRSALDLDSGWAAQLAGHTRANAARLVPELAGEVGMPAADLSRLEEEAERARFLSDLAACVEAVLGASPPGLLLVDDAQWLDPASVEVLVHLVWRLPGRPMCLVVCQRSAELGEERLEALRGEARRSALLDEIRLERLGRGDVVALAAASGQDTGVGAELYTRSEGNPYFVIEYLELLRASPSALETADRLPRGIRELIASRLVGVSPEARQILAAAAVVGRSFDAQLLRMASGRSADETVRALEELVVRGLVLEHGPQGDASGYDFDHEMTREVILVETTLARRRLLHRRVAAALQMRGRWQSSGVAAVIADHYRSAGDDRDAARFLRQAGREAERLFANRQALEHYQSALALDASFATELHQRIGDLQTLLGLYADAVASYESAAALVSGQALGPIEHRLAKVHERRGEWALAEVHYLAALAAGPEDPNGQARILADRSLVAHRRGDPAAARILAAQALSLATPAADAMTLAQVHNLLGIVAKGAGSLDEARSQLEKSLEHAVEQPSARIAALNNLALVERAGDRPERAMELTRGALRLCVTLGDRHHEAALRNNLADLLHAAGRSDEAMAQLTDAVRIFAEIGEPGSMQPEIWKLVEW